MFPVLIEIGDFALHTYGALGAVGFLLVAALLLRDARRLGWSRDGVVDVLFWSALGGILGARGLFLLQSPESMDGLMSWINLRTGGLVFYGAPLVGLPVGLAVARWRGLPILPLFDAGARALPLAHGISRIGCLGAGCCYGQPTSLPWGVSYSHPLTAGPTGVVVHPVQLYEALGLFVLSGVLSWRLHRPHRQGDILLGYLGGYAVLRFLTEMFRGDVSRGFVPGTPLSTSQGIAIGVGVLVVGVVLATRGRRPPARLEAPDPSGEPEDGTPEDDEAAGDA